MKGRTTCPKCKFEFYLDLPEKEKHEVVCPKCNNKFSIQAKCNDSKKFEECSWEEHGEPRKTVLSSIKPKTNMPRFAAIILAIVFIIGISTAALSESFIESSLDVASLAGLTGSMKILVTDQTNNSLSDVEIEINDISGVTNSKGFFSASNIELGVQELVIQKNNYKNQTREILISPFFQYESTIVLENESGKIKTIDFNSSGCTIILVIFSIIALIGSIVCLKRQYFDIAIVSSFIAIFSFGFFLIGSILAIIAFIIIFRSKDEFENGKKGKIF
jgi:DNA-directed RNA polymerase subunit RPC12/RpoP